jgi:hypothetical protein
MKSAKPGLKNMKDFKVIAGSGHCGTTWLAHVLDTRTDEVWYHDLRSEMVHILSAPWTFLDLKQPDDMFFENYWRWIAGELVQQNVGDSNSWPPHLLPAVNKRMPIKQVIYLTRNGVQQLNSLATKSPPLSKNPLPKAAEIKLRKLRELAPQVPDKPWDQWARFEKLCLMVLANDFMPDWLRNQGFVVDVYSLNTLTEDVEALSELVPHLSEEELVECQKTDINRKVEGGRAESTLWRRWPSEWRKAYREIVG